MCLYKQDYLKSGKRSSDRPDTEQNKGSDLNFLESLTRWNGEFRTDGLGERRY